VAETERQELEKRAEKLHNEDGDDGDGGGEDAMDDDGDEEDEEEEKEEDDKDAVGDKSNDEDVCDEDVKLVCGMSGDADAPEESVVSKKQKMDDVNDGEVCGLTEPQTRASQAPDRYCDNLCTCKDLSSENADASSLDSKKEMATDNSNAADPSSNGEEDSGTDTGADMDRHDPETESNICGVCLKLKTVQLQNTSHVYTGPELLELFKGLHTGEKVTEGLTTVGMVTHTPLLLFLLFQHLSFFTYSSFFSFSCFGSTDWEAVLLYLKH